MGTTANERQILKAKVNPQDSGRPLSNVGSKFRCQFLNGFQVLIWVSTKVPAWVLDFCMGLVVNLSGVHLASGGFY